MEHASPTETSCKRKKAKALNYYLGKPNKMSIDVTSECRPVPNPGLLEFCSSLNAM